MLAFVSGSCQGMEGSDVCVGDVAGCSERSNFFGRKWPWPTLCAQRVGNFVDVTRSVASSSWSSSQISRFSTSHLLLLFSVKVADWLWNP